GFKFFHALLRAIKSRIDVGRIRDDVVIRAGDLFEEVAAEYTGCSTFGIRLDVLLDGRVMLHIDLREIYLRVRHFSEDRDAEHTRARAEVEHAKWTRGTFHCIYDL